MKRLHIIAALASILLSASLAPPARADRVVLAPADTTLDPDNFKAEGLYSPYGGKQNREWLQYSSARQIELEYNRSGLRTDKVRHSFNIQYPLLTDLGAYPAVSIGMRDIFGTGLERQSVYLAIGKTIGLTQKQEKLVRRLNLSVGYGTGYMGGGFIGIQSRFRGGLRLDAEVFRNRPNASLGFDLTRNLQIKAYSLDGTVHYGLSFALIK